MTLQRFLVLAALLALVEGDFVMAQPPAASASDSMVEITAGGASALGPGSVGIDWVAKDGKSAKISLGGTAAGTRWATRIEVHPDTVVAIAGALFRVNAILPPSGGHRGHVRFAPAAGDGALPADAVVLTTVDSLRLGGPELDAATALRVTSYQPDDRNPASADVEWWPALHAREDAEAGTVKSAKLTPGSRIVVGTTPVSVLRIEGTTKDRAARIILQVLPATRS